VYRAAECLTQRTRRVQRVRSRTLIFADLSCVVGSTRSTNQSLGICSDLHVALRVSGGIPNRRQRARARSDIVTQAFEAPHAKDAKGAKDSIWNADLGQSFPRLIVALILGSHFKARRRFLTGPCSPLRQQRDTESIRQTGWTANRVSLSRGKPPARLRLLQNQDPPTKATLNPSLSSSIAV
jgi:hypothetical protein